MSLCLSVCLSHCLSLYVSLCLACSVALIFRININIKTKDGSRDVMVRVQFDTKYSTAFSRKLHPKHFAVHAQTCTRCSKCPFLCEYTFSCNLTYSFYARKQLMLSARLSHRNSVRPSVRPSVCPSHGWISQKRYKLGSPNLHYRLLEDSSFRNRKAFHKFEKGHPERGR